MTTELAFSLLNTAITTFCLIYSLNISHSNQNASVFPVEELVSNQNSYFGKILPYRNDRSHTKIILKFLFVQFSNCRGRRKYVLHGLLIFSRVLS